MSSRVEWLASAATAISMVAAVGMGERALPGGPPAGVDHPPLIVCADPNNLPFSNDRLEGFENKLAAIIAADLGRQVRYTWLPQRRGFVRNTLRAGRCDVLAGVPSSFELARPTVPYYRSTYVFVYRSDRRFHIRSFDDSLLHHLKIGVHVIGDDYANVPPAEALAQRHIIDNVVGYSIYGDYSKPNPPADLIAAVARGEVDVAIVWGPLAGYFAPRQKVALEIVPVSPQIDVPFLPFVFDIAMAVRRGGADDSLYQQLNGALERHKPEIHRLLDSYGVPMLPLQTGN